MACPACQSDAAPKAVRMSWWGGAVGPKLLSHVECAGCHTRYNATTGRSNNRAIATYLAVTLVLSAGIIYFLNS